MAELSLKSTRRPNTHTPTCIEGTIQGRPTWLSTHKQAERGLSLEAQAAHDEETGFRYSSSAQLPAPRRLRTPYLDHQRHKSAKPMFRPQWNATNGRRPVVGTYLRPDSC
jgi:hypothetical protein